MCGICGYISRKALKLDELKTMNDTMYHRGPNDSGEELFDAGNDYQLGLAQRRLSILDLSMLGHQPMHSCNDRLIIVYNGEIYNFLELKKELSDYPFKSNCDTEVILAAYLKWGISCIDRFQGMFAIALYDRETKELFLVRDRIGKKPLYYWYENENLVFASELKPIMAHPNFKKTIRRDVIKRYMYQQCVNEPDSIFENVYKVEPGQIVKFDVKASQKLSKWKYWDIATVYNKMKNKPVGSYEEAKAELKDILRDSVKKRMISDVPLGAFLSGGYDSSLVTAIAQEASSEPVKTYSIGFNEERYNEAKYAKEVANHLGTKHTELYIDEEAMFKMVDSIPKYYDEPFADSSQIPTMLVSELASKDVTVVLSGDGGDEFFCGYNIYDNVAQAQKLDFLGRMTYGVCSIPPFKQMGLLEKLPFRVQVVAGNNNPLTKTQIGGATYISAINKMLPESGIPFKFPIEDKYNESNWQERRMLLDEDTYLPGDILCKVDRASMKYSIESRCPILDVNVMEYSYRLPHDYKYSGGVKKRILKDIAYDYIPKSLLDRPKVGFSVPLDKWMRGALKEQLMDLCNSNYIKRQGIFDAEYINEFIADYMKKGDGGSGTGSNYSRLIWSYFVFQQWYNFYI
ncbi:MAG: asparagine synthase (glutamine-hydrolyzing) [Lachnospiraceae bacterium]|nr:asparagine synthase (glutamine-hydrolyzing) [Lachnospiraceae bacterium]MBQ5851117.1 asparagine synthase (glutamine-hydrolyzing) [Lachnospiraceae bacterium]